MIALARKAQPVNIQRSSHGNERIVARIPGRDFDELYVACAPAPDERASFGAQARSMYANLGRALAGQRVDGAVVLSERVFVDAIDREFAELVEIRRKFYHDLDLDRPCLPATAYIQQPPCETGQLCALQVHVLLPNGSTPLDLKVQRSEDGYGTARILNTAEGRHLFVANVVPHDRPGSRPYVFGDQAQHLFEEAHAILEKAGVRWTDVLRTWFWLSEMDRDYAEFNRVRNAFYHEQGITRLPASTGISGAPYPSERLCAMDIYAFQSAAPCEMRLMHSPGMNEASTYGAAFSRGLRLTTPESTTLFISGTASIDDAGLVVHVGDVEKQIERTCQNIESLLAAQGATVDDLVSLISYLKSRSSLAVFESVLRRRSWPRDLTNTIVEAGVCRPDWLVEVEAIAILKR